MVMEDNTQEIEGYNSILKMLGNRSPNMTLELTSARANMKKTLGFATPGYKSSHLLDAAVNIHRDLGQYIKCTDVVFGAANSRWESPAIQNLPTEAEIQAAWALANPSLQPTKEALGLKCRSPPPFCVGHPWSN